VLVLFIYNKTSIKRNILTMKQNTSGSRSGYGLISTLSYFLVFAVEVPRGAGDPICCVGDVVRAWHLFSFTPLAVSKNEAHVPLSA
jgi:hypothetical protein